MCYCRFAGNYVVLSKTCRKDWFTVLGETWGKQPAQLWSFLEFDLFCEKRAENIDFTRNSHVCWKTSSKSTFNFELAWNWLLFSKKVRKTSIWEQVGLFELKLVQNSARKSKFGWIGFSYQERSMQCFRWNLWKTACATVSLLEIKLKKKYRKCQFDKKALCFSLNYWKSACATIYLLEIDRFCQKSAVSIDLPFYVKFVQKNMHNC